jgi:cbb3-type cytochrome oxidase maturation protein
VNVLYLLIPLGLVLLALALWAFFWAVRNGQFDDLDLPGVQILLDDDRAPRSSRAASPVISQQPDSINSRDRRDA